MSAPPPPGSKAPPPPGAKAPPPPGTKAPPPPGGKAPPPPAPGGAAKAPPPPAAGSPAKAPPPPAPGGAPKPAGTPPPPAAKPASPGAQKAPPPASPRTPSTSVVGAPPPAKTGGTPPPPAAKPASPGAPPPAAKAPPPPAGGGSPKPGPPPPGAAKPASPGAGAAKPGPPPPGAAKPASPGAGAKAPPPPGSKPASPGAPAAKPGPPPPGGAPPPPKAGGTPPPPAAKPASPGAKAPPPPAGGAPPPPAGAKASPGASKAPPPPGGGPPPKAPGSPSAAPPPAGSKPASPSAAGTKAPPPPGGGAPPPPGAKPASPKAPASAPPGAPPGGPPSKGSSPKAAPSGPPPSGAPPGAPPGPPPAGAKPPGSKPASPSASSGSAPPASKPPGAPPGAPPPGSAPPPAPKPASTGAPSGPPPGVAAPAPRTTSTSTISPSGSSSASPKPSTSAIITTVTTIGGVPVSTTSTGSLGALEPKVTVIEPPKEPKPSRPATPTASNVTPPPNKPRPSTPPGGLAAVVPPPNKPSKEASTSKPPSASAPSGPPPAAAPPGPPSGKPPSGPPPSSAAAIGANGPPPGKPPSGGPPLTHSNTESVISALSILEKEANKPSPKALGDALGALQGSINGKLGASGSPSAASSSALLGKGGPAGGAAGGPGSKNGTPGASGTGPNRDKDGKIILDSKAEVAGKNSRPDTPTRSNKERMEMATKSAAAAVNHHGSTMVVSTQYPPTLISTAGGMPIPVRGTSGGSAGSRGGSPAASSMLQPVPYSLQVPTSPGASAVAVPGGSAFSPVSLARQASINAANAAAMAPSSPGASLMPALPAGFTYNQAAPLSTHPGLGTISAAAPSSPVAPGASSVTFSGLPAGVSQEQLAQVQQLQSMGYAADPNLIKALGLTHAAHALATIQQQQGTGVTAGGLFAGAPASASASSAGVPSASSLFVPHNNNAAPGSPQPGAAAPDSALSEFSSASLTAASQLSAMAAASSLSPSKSLASSRLPVIPGGNPSNTELAAAKDIQRDAARSTRSTIDKAPQEERRELFAAARDKVLDCRDRENELRRRLQSSMPREMDDLRIRLVGAVGPQAAESKLNNISRIARLHASRQGINSLLRLAESDTSLLSNFVEGQSLPVRNKREDLRSCRSGLEAAIAEEQKQGVEMTLNASVLQNCIEQARRLAEAAMKTVEDDLRSVADGMNAASRKMLERTSDVTALLTADTQAELASLRSSAAELKDRVATRAVDAERAKEAKERLQDEFTTLKDTVDKHRRGESDHAGTLAAEVAALEKAASSRNSDLQAALQREVAGLRRVAAAEAERMGSQMLIKIRQESETAIEALRTAAGARVQTVVDDAGKAVGQEFEGIMSSLEDKRRQNAERISRLRESLAVVESQIDAVRKSVSSQQHQLHLMNLGGGSGTTPSKSSSSLVPSPQETQLTALKRAVRQHWARQDVTVGGSSRTQAALERLQFLTRVLQLAPYSHQLHEALLRQVRSMRERASSRLLLRGGPSTAASFSPLPSSGTLSSSGRTNVDLFDSTNDGLAGDNHPLAAAAARGRRQTTVYSSLSGHQGSTPAPPRTPSVAPVQSVSPPTAVSTQQQQQRADEDILSTLASLGASQPRVPPPPPPRQSFPSSSQQQLSDENTSSSSSSLFDIGTTAPVDFATALRDRLRGNGQLTATTNAGNAPLSASSQAALRSLVGGLQTSYSMEKAMAGNSSSEQANEDSNQQMFSSSTGPLRKRLEELALSSSSLIQQQDQHLEDISSSNGERAPGFYASLLSSPESMSRSRKHLLEAQQGRDRISMLQSAPGVGHLKAQQQQQQGQQGQQGVRFNLEGGGNVRQLLR